MVLGADLPRAHEVVGTIVTTPIESDLLVAWIARELQDEDEPLSPHREELRRRAQRLSWRLKSLLRMAESLDRVSAAFEGPREGDALGSLLYSRRWEVRKALQSFEELDRLEPERFDLLASWVEEFERSVAPTTLHFLLQSERESVERMVRFLSTRFVAREELERAMVQHLGGDALARRMVEALGVDFLRTKSPVALGRMRPNFERWAGVVRFYQDQAFRASCPVELVEAASDAYLELLRRIEKTWRTELRSVDTEDAVQETITRLVGEGLQTYRYESNLLNYLAEVATDYLRRQYHRPKACELVGDEPIVDGRPSGPAWARARDRLQQMREIAPEVIQRKFKASNWPVAQRIWDEVLREADRELDGGTNAATGASSPAPLTDEELAEEIARSAGRCVSVPNLRVIRSRLRTAMGEALGLRPAE